MASTTNTSAQANSGEQTQTMSQGLIQQSQVLGLLTSQSKHPDHHHNTIGAAAKVFGITELLEKVLLNVDDDRELRNAAQVSKTFQATILGSIKAQRRLHNAPIWTQTKITPAPFPDHMVTFAARSDGKFDHEHTPLVEAGTSHAMNMRFQRDGVALACDPESTVNGSFRNMLICQPPVVAVGIFCWSTVNYRPKLEQRRIENENGITCGQLFDLVQASSPIGGNAKLTWFFAGGEKDVSQ